MSFRLADYQFNFPEDSVAMHPLEDRSASRLMCLNVEREDFSHHFFSEIPHLLPQGAVLVLNETKVFPARFFCKKKTGGKIEIVLIEQIKDGYWKAIGQPVKRLRKGMRLNLLYRGSEEISNEELEIVEAEHGPIFEVKLPCSEGFGEWIKPYGQMPLPPYIRRQVPEDEDFVRYQTVFANKIGSAASPTAGLHFTPQILKALQLNDVEILKVCLHVGPGTFFPVKSPDIRQHSMHEEYYEMSQDVHGRLVEAKKQKRPIICVGTTTLRVLETVFMLGEKNPLSGYTSLYIYPGFCFQMADALLTNFHQPQSSLFILVAAFAGLSSMQEVYREAMAQKYRLFSYGDCMLIFK